MNTEKVSLVLVVSLVTVVRFCQASDNSKAESSKQDFALEIHFPREITVKDNHLTLGQVGVIHGNEALVAKASKIALGRISVPGQVIVIDRPVILSRLACSGICASEVKLTGAQQITIRGQKQIITGDEFVELARSFLKKNPPAGSACQLDPVVVPKDLVLPAQAKQVSLSPWSLESSTKNLAKVRVVVFADGKEAAAREVAFRLKYDCRKAVTLVEIAPGEVISPENVKIEKTESDYPEAANWVSPYGLIAKRRLPANTVVHPNAVSPAKSEFIVGRNETVVIRIERPGLLVTALGKAMQTGQEGEYIKVRNMDSQRIILCKVNQDRTVEPVF
jgi:flagella basal body P-ring formation protein FlgA